ncbi:amidohydrolase family protein [Robiginitalea aurantiaca]|uniref:Amidohydrolase family protein n=1 Tax=Robiginitalea aurantiaca TaxID=3056915 RepID=A0ABT7WGR5_9FLAO|nr:amidohydrolase family protein [Robiginitalea aurantiaca]MDM9632114.1 amidohydrolase family protein [Robiginitalea aurantiaca]
MTGSLHKWLPILALCIGCNSAPESQIPTTVLQGATLFDGNGERIEKGIVVIQEGRIVEMGDSETNIPKGADVIDLSGKFITPGLVDAHVHFGQTGFFDGRPDALDLRDTLPYETVQKYLSANPDRYYEAYLRSGVTAVYDVGGYEWSLELPASAEENLNAPHVAAAGPLLTPVPQENLQIINTAEGKQLIQLTSPELGRERVKKHSQMGATGIKIWMIALNDSVFMNSLRAVQEEVGLQNNKLIVHATSLDQAKEALRLGAKVLVHSVDDKPLDDEFIELAKKAGVIYCPTLVVLRGYNNAAKALQNNFTVNDPNGAVDAQTKDMINSGHLFFKYYPNPETYEADVARESDYFAGMEAIMAANLKQVYEAGIPIALSTDAGNPGTLHGISIYDELEAMQEAGIPPSDIISMATRNGALAMERGDDFGTLEVGKMADLIVLEKDPSANAAHFRSITHVMRGGLLRPVNEAFKEN